MRSAHEEPLPHLGQHGHLDRLRHRAILVIGEDPSFTGPWASSPVAALAHHLATRASSVVLVTGVPRLPDGAADARYRLGLTFREPPATVAAPEVTRLRHHVPHRRTPLRRLVGDLTFLGRALTTPLGMRPDLVVAVTPEPGGAVAGARIAQRHGVPLLLLVHDLVGGDPGWPTAVHARAERFALGAATRVAVPGETLRTAVLRYGVPGERVVVLPNVASPRRSTDRLTARRRLGWQAGAFVVVAPDPLTPGHDLDVLLAAGERLGPRADLVLVAQGAHQTEAMRERLAGHPRVYVVDPPDGERRALTLAAADVLLVSEDPAPAGGGPARRGAAALEECFRAGRPLIAAAGPAGYAAREITLSRGAGVLVRPGDPVVLASAVAQLRRDGALRAAMGAAGRSYADQRLDRGASMLALDALVEGLCADVVPPGTVRPRRG